MWIILFSGYGFGQHENKNIGDIAYKQFRFFPIKNEINLRQFIEDTRV